MYISNLQNTVAGEFNRLDAARTAVLERGRKCAELTIPAMLPPAGSNETQELAVPDQSFGARAVNNLSSKLLLALLAPNSPFFKFTLAPDKKAQLSKEDLVEVETALAGYERTILAEIETRGYRVPYYQCLRYLVTIGYALLYLPDDGPALCYRPDSFVVQRDPSGNVLKIIVKEVIDYAALPKELQATVETSLVAHDPKRSVNIFTEVKREDGHWAVRQEVDGRDVDGSVGTYPLDACPWIAPRWSSLAGENYGRGHVEEFLGDLTALSDLSKALVDAALVASRVVFFRDPNSAISIKQVERARNGDVLIGNAADMTCLHVEKQADFRVSLDALQRLDKALSGAFLLVSSVTRDAERVTREEIRMLAGELDTASGGVYSLLSMELQLPFLRRVIRLLTKAKRVPSLSKHLVIPMITSGVDALARSAELAKIDQLLVGLPPQALEMINIRALVKRKAEGLGIDIEGFLYTEQELQAQKQQAMLMQLAQDAGPGVIQQASGGMIEQGVTNNGQETE